MASEFVVPRWLRNPHVQTLGAAMSAFAPPRSHAALDAEHVRVPLASPSAPAAESSPVGPSRSSGATRPVAEDVLEGHALHARVWWVTSSEQAPRPLVVLVHGIGGSGDSPYVVRAAVALHRAGHHVARLDLRGAGRSVPDVPSLYHAGLSADLARVAAHFAADPRVSGIVLFGFSGGGSQALKLAGEWGESPPPYVRAIVSVSAPLDYTRVAPWMDSAARLPYRFHVLRGLTEAARSFARLHPGRAHYAPSEVRRLSSFRHYDGAVIVPMHGFSDVDTYYEAASAGPWLRRIAIPTLLMHAGDDPMVPSETVRPWLAAASRAVDVAETRHGGHIGWVAGFDEESWIGGWTHRRALSFLAGRVG